MGILRVRKAENANVDKTLVVALIFVEDGLEGIDSCSRLGYGVGEDRDANLGRFVDIRVVDEIYEP